MADKVDMKNFESEILFYSKVLAPQKFYGFIQKPQQQIISDEALFFANIIN